MSADATEYLSGTYVMIRFYNPLGMSHVPLCRA